MKKKLIKYSLVDDEIVAVSAYYFSISPEISLKFEFEINRALDKLEENLFAFLNISIKPYRRIVIKGFPYALVSRLMDDKLFIVMLFPLKNNPNALMERIRKLYI
jgi:hypothetical protein